jgi:hypothetical protein
MENLINQVQELKQQIDNTQIPEIKIDIDMEMMERNLMIIEQIITKKPININCYILKMVLISNNNQTQQKCLDCDREAMYMIENTDKVYCWIHSQKKELLHN